MAYRVVSPLVLVRDEQGSVQYLYAGAVVPAYVGKDRLEVLVEEGHIDGEPEPEPEPAKPGKS